MDNRGPVRRSVRPYTCNCSTTPLLSPSLSSFSSLYPSSLPTFSFPHSTHCLSSPPVFLGDCPEPIRSPVETRAGSFCGYSHCSFSETMDPRSEIIIIILLLFFCTVVYASILFYRVVCSGFRKIIIIYIRNATETIVFRRRDPSRPTPRSRNGVVGVIYGLVYYKTI